MNTLRLLALPAAAVVALTLTGCGDDTPSGGSAADAEAYAKTDLETIKSDYAEAMGSLTSMRMVGDFLADDQKVAVDLAMDRDGNCAGSMTTDAMSFELRVNPDNAYIKADAATWDSFAPGTSETIGDKWVTGFPMDGFDEMCDMDGLVEQMSDDDQEDATVSGTGEVDGVASVIISATSEDDETVKIDIAASAPHYILAAGTEESGQVKFTDFNKAVDASSPADDEVFDFSGLS